MEMDSGYLMRVFLREVYDGLFGTDRRMILEAAERRGLYLAPDRRFRFCRVNMILESLKGDLETLLNLAQKKAADIFFPGEDLRYIILWRNLRWANFVVFLEEERFSEGTIRTGLMTLSAYMKDKLGITTACFCSRPYALYDALRASEELTIVSYSYGAFDQCVLISGEWDVSATRESLDEKRMEDYLERREREGLLFYVRSEVDHTELQGGITADYLDNAAEQIKKAANSYLADMHVQFDFTGDRQFGALRFALRTKKEALEKLAGYVYDKATNLVQSAQKSQTLMGKAKEYIEKHYAEEITREALANHIGVTPNYMSKLWNSGGDRNLREYINLCRVSAARRLLAGTDLSVTEISFRTGFGSSAHFSAIFKKVTGQSPSQWRKQAGTLRDGPGAETG